MDKNPEEVNPPIGLKRMVLPDDTMNALSILLYCDLPSVKKYLHSSKDGYCRKHGGIDGIENEQEKFCRLE